MGKITDIKPQQKNKSRVSLFIDGRFFCGLEKIAAAEHRLNIGDEIDEVKLTETVFESECASAFEKSAKYLGIRPRTAREIKTYLAGKGYSDKVVQRTSDKLTEYGYIDDKDYCRLYVEFYKAKSGVKKLESELRQKGISDDIINEALSEIDDQTESALRLAEKYLRSHAPDKRKLTAYLLSKGFEYDSVREAVKSLDDCDFD